MTVEHQARSGTFPLSSYPNGSAFAGATPFAWGH
jgi:hypothetical protein